MPKPVVCKNCGKPEGDHRWAGQVQICPTAVFKGEAKNTYVRL